MRIIIGPYVVQLSPTLLNIFKKQKQDEPGRNESGGILLGQLANEIIHIKKLSLPNIYDKATRFSFERDKTIAQIIINHEFVNSEGKVIYLGEWHSHPEDYPTPSPQDLFMIREQYLGNQLNSNFILLIVVGIKAVFLGVYDGQHLHSQLLNH